jgi:hypothetical protein
MSRVYGLVNTAVSSARLYREMRNRMAGFFDPRRVRLLTGVGASRAAYPHLLFYRAQDDATHFAA